MSTGEAISLFGVVVAILIFLAGMLKNALDKINQRIDTHLTAEENVFQDMRADVANTREDLAFIAGAIGITRAELPSRQAGVRGSS